MSGKKECKGADIVVPRVDLNRCEGKHDCVDVCPHNVFQVRVLPEAERDQLTRLGRVKSFFHGHRKAFVVHPDQCHACGSCVTACPEHAITLVSAKSGTEGTA
ncbi:MAG: ferredoxin family protein [Myxococcota bacterium]